MRDLSLIFAVVALAVSVWALLDSIRLERRLRQRDETIQNLYRRVHEEANERLATLRETAREAGRLRDSIVATSRRGHDFKRSGPPTPRRSDDDLALGALATNALFGSGVPDNTRGPGTDQPSQPSDPQRPAPPPPPSQPSQPSSIVDDSGGGGSDGGAD